MWKLLKKNKVVLFLLFPILSQVSFFTVPWLMAQQLSGNVEDDLAQSLLIFPENKESNSIYRARQWLYSKEGAIIESGIYIKPLDITVALLSSPTGSGLSFVVLPSSKQNIFSNISPIAMKADFGTKTLVVMAVDKKLYAFLFNFKSISYNMVQNDKKQVAFYHLAKIEEDLETGSPVYQIKLHVFDANDKKLIILPYVLYSRSYALRLSWQEDRILVNFGDGNYNTYAVNY